MTNNDYCDLCNEEMFNFYEFTWDFKPTFSNVYVKKDDEGTIEICINCKQNLKTILFTNMKMKQSDEPGINGTVKYT